MFDYFYGNEHEQYLFLQIPIMLIKEPTFKPLSDGAKLLYGLLLTRTSLSIRNNWKDEQGRTYIIYTINDIMDDLNCATQKACKLIKELETIQLLESKRQGLNKPNLLYLKNFATRLKYTSNSANTRSFENQNSGVLKNEIQDFCKSKSNYNDFKKIYNNDIESVSQSMEEHLKEDRQGQTETYIENIEMDTKKERYLSHTPHAKINSDPNNIKNNLIEIDYNLILQNFQQQINYEFIIIDEPENKNILDEIVLIAIDTIMTKNEFVKIGGEDKPRSLVKGVLSKIGMEEVKHTIYQFKLQNHAIINKKGYLLKCLYNSPMEIKSHTQNIFNQHWK